jgi:hypothetical protein
MPRACSLTGVARSSEEQAVVQKIEATNEQLARLKRTNIFDDAFFISHDGGRRRTASSHGCC